jgi:hypothetical protein
MLAILLSHLERRRPHLNEGGVGVDVRYERRREKRGIHLPGASKASRPLKMRRKTHGHGHQGHQAFHERIVTVVGTLEKLGRRMLRYHLNDSPAH